MNLNTCLLKNNNCYKTKKTIIPKGVMWHSTGANNPSLKRYVQPDDGKLGTNKYNNSWNTAKPDSSEKCCHAFIGLLDDGKTVATYQTLPWNHRGWHCGAGSKGSCNDTHISFEICEDGLVDKVYFEKIYKEGVELTAFLCKKYKLDPMGDSVIIDHTTGSKLGLASAHGDVAHWFSKYNKTLVDIRKDVFAAMSDDSETSKEEEDSEESDAAAPFSVKVTIADLNYRSGPGLEYDIVGKTGVGVYTITETSGNWGKLKSGAGWILLSLDDVTSAAALTPYLVQIIRSNVKIFAGPSSTYKIVGYTGNGIFTIVDTSGGFGKLKSGAGWVDLSQTTKL